MKNRASVEHLIQLARPVLADADAVDVLEDLERLAGDRAHRAREPLGRTR